MRAPRDLRRCGSERLTHTARVDVAHDHVHLVAACRPLDGALPRALAYARLSRRGGGALQGVLVRPRPPRTLLLRPG